MKHLVGVDDDGHFFVIKLTDREAILKRLKDNCCFSDLIDYIDTAIILSGKEDVLIDWLYIQDVINRGRSEILEF